MENLLEINDWEIKKFLRLLLAIQLAVLGLVGLNALGYGIPVLTQIVSFVYLAFIPGVIILRTLKLHRLGSLKTLLYAVGLSIAFLMFLGFFINLLYPYIGIARPISTLPLIITITVVLSIFCFVAYVRDRGFSVPTQFSWGELLSPPVLFLILLPLLGILGAELVNFYQSNVVLMILMVLLALIPLLLVFTRFIPERLYPLAVGMVALSLLLHRSLISPYLWGSDIIGEYACYKMVEMNSLWVSTSPNLIGGYNSTLSVTILPAIFSNLLNMEGTWVFKAIFPLFLSLVPLAMYEMLRGQFSKKVAFLSCFFLVSLYLFYVVEVQIAKQLIATFFLALFAVSMVDKGIGSGRQRALLAIFGVALIVSHYSTAFLFTILVPAALVLLYVLRRKSSVLTISLAVIFIAVTFSWYMFNANAVVFKQFGWMGKSAVTVEAPAPSAEAPAPSAEAPAPSATFFDPASRDSYRIITRGSTDLPDALRYLYLTTQFLIAVGVIRVVWRWFRRKEKRISDEYIAFSILFLSLLALGLILPMLSQVVPAGRIYVISVLLLAPCCIIGGEVVLKTMSTGLSPGFWKARFKGRQKLASRNLSTGFEGNTLALKVLAVFFATFLLFNTGFVYELAGQPLNTSIALSREKVDFPIYSTPEINGAVWLLNNSPAAKSSSIYYDPRGYPIFDYAALLGEKTLVETGEQILCVSRGDPFKVVTQVPAHSYIYWRSFNVRERKMLLGWRSLTHTTDMRRVKMDSLGSFSTTIAESNIIYNNGGSQVLYTLRPYTPH